MDFKSCSINGIGIMRVSKSPAFTFEFDDVVTLDDATCGQNSTGFLHPYTAVEYFFRILEYTGHFHWNLVEDSTNVGDVANGHLTLRKDEKY